MEREEYKIMKKRIMLLMTALLTVAMLGGCGKENAAEGEDTEGKAANSVTLKDFDVDKLVTLGEYKGLEVVVAEPTVDEAQQQMYVKNLFQNGLTEEVGVKDRAVEEGDLTFISYVGTKDGEAFSGGTSEGTFLEIGSGQYIDGFEEGLVGVMPGETVDLNLTFPDPYQNPDLAGQDVVFTVTVIYIAPEMSDEVILAMGNVNYSNEEELNQYVYDMLLEQAGSDYDMRVENAVIEALIHNTTFEELPKELVEKYTENIISNMNSAAAAYGYNVDDYTMMLYGADAATIAASFGEDSAKQGLVFQAIANEENLNVTDEELDEKLMEYVKEYGLSSIEELLGDTDRNDYRDFFMFEKVVDLLVDSAVIRAE